MSIENKDRTKPLFILRFLAATSVVFYHYEPVELKKIWLHEIIKNCNEFVNFFYFISGFVLVIAYHNLIKNGRFLIIDFWVKRVARIYPVYLLALLLVLIYHFFYNPIFSSLSKRLPFEILMIQTWFYSGSINYPAWSVSCEFFFYLLFPFCFGILYNLYKNKNGKLIFIFLLTNIFLFGVAYHYFSLQDGNISKFITGLLTYHPITRVVVFFIGMFGAFLYIHNEFYKLFKTKKSHYIALISFFLIFLILYTLPQHFSLLNYGLLVPLYLIFVLSICNLKDSINNALSNKLFVFLGDISYSIYILQFPLYLFFCYLVHDIKSIKYFLVYVVVLFFFSALSFIFIEKPLRNYITRLFTKNNKFQLS